MGSERLPAQVLYIVRTVVEGMLSSSYWSMHVTLQFHADSSSLLHLMHPAAHSRTLAGRPGVRPAVRQSLSTQQAMMDGAEKDCPTVKTAHAAALSLSLSLFLALSRSLSLSLALSLSLSLSLSLVFVFTNHEDWRIVHPD
jgi:hypothetical protein